MKPHNSKVIVLFEQTHWNGMPVDVAVPVGRRIPARALNWLKQFGQTQGRALIFGEHIMEDGKYTGRQAYNAFGPPEFQSYMVERAARGEAPW